MEVLAKANQIVQVDNDVQTRAKELTAKGVMALDALHLAAAETGLADCFCTCDDKLLKKAKRLCAPTIKAVYADMSVDDIVVEIEKDREQS